MIGDSNKKNKNKQNLYIKYIFKNNPTQKYTTKTISVYIKNVTILIFSLQNINIQKRKKYSAFMTMHL